MILDEEMVHLINIKILNLHKLAKQYFSRLLTTIPHPKWNFYACCWCCYTVQFSHDYDVQLNIVFWKLNHIRNRMKLNSIWYEWVICRKCCDRINQKAPIIKSNTLICLGNLKNYLVCERLFNSHLQEFIGIKLSKDILKILLSIRK